MIGMTPCGMGLGGRGFRDYTSCIQHYQTVWQDSESLVVDQSAMVVSFTGTLVDCTGPLVDRVTVCIARTYFSLMTKKTLVRKIKIWLYFINEIEI